MSAANTKSLIRSCVVSTKSGLTVRQLARDFEDLVGSSIPYQQHGFQTLELFLRSIPDTVRLTSAGGETVVEQVPDESVAHIVALVSRQKSKQGKKQFPALKKTQPKKRVSNGQQKRSRLLHIQPINPDKTVSGPIEEKKCSQACGSGRAVPAPPVLSAAPANTANGTRPGNTQVRSKSSGARSASSTGHRHQASSAQLSMSSSDLSSGGRPARAAPALCQHHRPPHVCRQRPCQALHLCRLYVDGFCPRDADCRWGHTVKSADNWHALTAYQLQTLPESELLWLVRTLLRQTAPVSVEEYRRQLTVCADYAGDASCCRPDCFRLHVCPRLVAGQCERGAACRWSHQLADPENVMVLLRLKCAGLSEDEVLALLSRQPDDSSDDGSSPPSETSCEQRRASVSAWSEESSPLSGHQSQRCTAVSTTGTAPTATDSNHQPRTALSTVSVRRESAPNTSAGRLPTKSPKQLALDLDLCRYNVFPSTCPGNCQKLHLCRLYVAGMCPFVKTCRSGHAVKEPSHNMEVLRRREVHQLSEAELLEAIKAGYLCRNPITDLEREFIPQLCRPYNAGECHLAKCPRFHVCAQYVMRKCKNSGKCGKSHQLSCPRYAAIFRSARLSTLPHEKLLDALSSRLTAGQSALDNGHSAATSCGALDPGGTPAQEVHLPSSAGPHSGEAPALCAVHASGSYCQRPDCQDFHVCGFFLANLCRRSDLSCRSGHSLETKHNQRVMALHGLASNSTDRFQTLVGRMTLQARITFANNAHTNVRLCVPYNSSGSCAKRCGRFHVCHRYLAGSCPSKGCELRHDLAGAHNQYVREVLGLSAAPSSAGDTPWATDRDLTELLRARLGAPQGVYRSPECVVGLPAPSSACNRNGAQVPLVCGMLGAGLRCTKDGCTAVHICPHFLAGACRRQNCALGHRLTSEHNQRALQASGRTVTADNHDSLVRQLYAASQHIPRTEVYNKLRICIRYNQVVGCSVVSCTLIHICQRFVACTCEDDCGKGHELGTKQNKEKLRALGLEDSPADKVLEMLRAIHGTRSPFLP